jgi:hypothetical protein
MRHFIEVMVFLSFTTNVVVAQNSAPAIIPVTTTQSDTTHPTTTDLYEGTDDSAPGLALFALIGIGFVLACVGADIALTVIGLLIIFGLISFGILSASVLIGINRKSFALGFKTFLVSTSTIFGLLLCGFGFWILNQILHWWTTQTALTIGAGLGLFAGVAFGLTAFYVLQRLTTYLRDQLKLKEG